ncbi:MAG: hypothetical protein ACFCVH_01160 [Alphaproteobacteria bacterium]
MDCWNVNLLGAEQLAALGLSKQQVALVLKARPIASVLDLLLVEGLAAPAVNALLAQGVLAGISDRRNLLLDGLPIAGLRFVAFLADDKEGDGGGAPFTEVLSPDHFYELEPAGKTPALVIPDCTGKETVTIRGYGSAQRELKPGEGPADVEKEAQGLAEATLVAAIGTIALRTSCQDKQGLGCTATVVKLAKRSVNQVYSVPRKRRQPALRPAGWKARYVALAEVEVVCQKPS